MKLAPEPFISRWPGKSAVAPDGPRHPAVYHMLDVAAVAELLIARRGLPAPVERACVLLVALHDLGKIGAEFRAMLDGARAQTASHWQVSEALLHTHDDRLAHAVQGRPAIRGILVAAVAGHHGRPPSAGTDDLDRMTARAGAQAREDAAAVIDAFASLWSGASLDGLSRNEARHLSWWLAGLTTTADWVGSNADWFAPRGPDLSLADYLVEARLHARAAVAQAGLDDAVALEGRKLFDFDLRPIQSAAVDIELPDGPLLVVMEDETGAGKTEAALLLAQRMLRAGKGQGLFFALPTMATADAMFARLEGSVGRMLANPSLSLAHGRSGLSVPFKDLIGRVAEGEEDVTCAPWLADGRRRALLADVGVGTIDQALLGALPTKFATLRLWGLSSKILIVDEVHELGEPYMAAVLESLLRAHAGMGGSAILMTATLPLGQRAKLMKAFQEGAGRPAPAHLSAAYPSLCVAGGAAIADFPKRQSDRGPVRVDRLPDSDAAIELLIKAAQAGAAAVWVRNAVDDAIAAVDELRRRGVAADLLHARYALCDRKRIEAQMLARFGRAGADRKGRVLIATQVVESSLDLCFDVMVSDLAPMAALIQRAGRLWRHMDLRPAAQRPVPAAVLHVLAPDPEQVEDARWLSQVLDRGAFVYPLADQWRTASTLLKEGWIDAPGRLRALIEAVHGDDCTDVPAALRNAETNDLGEQAARRNHGWSNAVRFDDGYREAGGGAKDTEYPTRLGLEQRTLVLARDDGRGLRPWADGGGPEAWMLSEVQAAAYRVGRIALPDQSAPAIAALTRDWPEWRRQSVIVCPVGRDGAICEGLYYMADRGLGFRSSRCTDDP